MKDKIVIPEGMLKAAMDAWDSCGHDASHRVDTDYYKRRFLKAALRWLSAGKLSEMLLWKLQAFVSGKGSDQTLHVSTALLDSVASTLFLAPESEVPEEIQALLWKADGTDGLTWTCNNHNDAILEAFRRGRNSK